MHSTHTTHTHAIANASEVQMVSDGRIVIWLCAVPQPAIKSARIYLTGAREWVERCVAD